MPSLKYLCIHGHFYQPSRENPWTGEVPLEPGAYPFHDWNARISAEAYGANAWSQIRDAKGHVAEIINNYEHISFDFGPTLLSWLETHDQPVYRAIIAADKASQSRFSGYGSAIAQCYNHMIMPLANRRDKITQIVWGLRDFAHRFGRASEGVWLPETAVDLETLELAVEQGVKFTILAPHQVASTRRIGADEWQPTPGDTADPTQPYLVHLPSGKLIIVFVYNGATARAVAFERLLDSGEQFAARLLAGFDTQKTTAQLAHVATDGETYGHHHRFGDMALAYAISVLGKHSGIRLTNYSEYLRLHPPTHEAQIRENTSWSCAHGIERWRSDCGCNSGAHPGWNQKWRAPLREALDWLRDEVNTHYEPAMARLVKDPWAARDDYISVMLSPGDESEKAFFARHQAKRLTAASRWRTLELLRLQKHMMLLYSSCGWFFDDISGVEAAIILRHAGWVIEQARALLRTDTLDPFLSRLRAAASNDPQAGDGEAVFRHVAH